MYKVTCNLYAIMKGGEVGNIIQKTEEVYTNVELSEIQECLEVHFRKEKRFPHIKNVSEIKGKIVN